MSRVVFTSHLAKHLDAPPQSVAAGTVREALESVFQDNPRLRGYVLDDQNCLRRHVIVFVDSRIVADRRQLSDPIKPDSEIYVMQALSGG